MSIVFYVGVGFVIPTAVHLGYNPKYQVEVSADVSWRSPDSSIKGQLVQEWLWTGTEQRQLELTFASGNYISFDYTTGILVSRVNGKEDKQEFKLREEGDVLPTPMSHEYKNIVNDAVVAFDRKEVIDPIGIAPFESIMLSYDLWKKNKKSNL